MTLLAALLLLTEVFPATIADPGFDRGFDAWGTAGHRGYRVSLGSNFPARPAERWLEIGWAARSRAPNDADYRVFTFVDARRYRGRRVYLSAAVRVRGRGASLEIVSDRASGRMALEASDRWRRQGLLFQVPHNAETIEIRFRLRGGALDADDVRLDIMR